jgi:hypothetical protein
VPAAPLVPAGEDQGRFNAEVETTLRRVTESPIAAGRLVDVGTLATGANNRVEHGLGRTPLGWFVVGVTAQADLWEGAAPDDVVLNLRTDSATADWRIWVF